MTTTPTGELRHLDVGGDQLAYREFGSANGGVPLMMLSRFRGTIDDWTWPILSGLAAGRHVIAFDNAGVGLSEGEIQPTIQGMADTAVAFIQALGYESVDVLGFSMGGYIAQRIALTKPELVRSIVLVGTGPGGGEGATYPGPIVAEYTAPDKTPLQAFGALFFSNSDAGKNAAQAYVTTITSSDRPKGSRVSDEASQIQRAAIQAWWGGEGSSLPELEKITQPMLVINGNRDVMVPTPNSFLMSQKLPNAQLIVYPDSGHGSLFQYPVSFVRSVLQFLNDQSTGGAA